MSRRRRRQQAEDLAQRFKELRPEQAGWIMLVLVSNALISSAVQVILVTSYVGAARWPFRVRRHESRSTAHGALSRPEVALTCAHVVHLICTQTLLSRWTRRAVRRAEACASAREPDSAALNIALAVCRRAVRSRAPQPLSADRSWSQFVIIGV